MRQIILDTETTGLDPKDGHRVIEIGCIELVNRRLTDQTFHVYINPERQIDQEAIDVHGITNEFLADKPNFAGIADEFVEFIRGAELIAHNASFDINFLDSELSRIPEAPNIFSLMHGGAAIDTLAMAKEKRPGKRNSLDALCRDYKIDASERTLHGALLDAELLTRVYLAMTREQSRMFGETDNQSQGSRFEPIQRLTGVDRVPRVSQPTDADLANHQSFLNTLRETKTQLLWDSSDT
ncbi:MAG: DNA polymerase III subunit epsilon [Pseudomonadota bacterium]|nr:DNA polymerase III subunit epsilon [Pseudomonadota bacterium]